MAKEKFKYGELEVEVEDVGDGEAPWDERGETRTQYEMKVKGAGGKYKAPGWGSTKDYLEGRFAHRTMAQMVINDLVSAASDPNEWITMVIGDKRGRDALAAGKMAEKIVKAAQKFDQDALFAAGEAARAEEEAGIS